MAKTLGNIDGITFSRIALSGGGDGLYDGVDGDPLGKAVVKQYVGMGREITLPKYAIFVIQREESRGSRVIPAVGQYLHKQPQ